MAVASGLLFGTTQASADVYTVQSGDTLNKIAADNQTTVDKIASDNNISDVNLIYVGEQFNISLASARQEPVKQNEVDNQPVVPASVPVSGGDAKEWIANKESGGSYTAQNPSGAYGRYQLMSFNLKYGTSPEAQERAADEYVSARYGSWDNAKAFWLQHNWY